MRASAKVSVTSFGLHFVWNAWSWQGSRAHKVSVTSFGLHFVWGRRECDQRVAIAVSVTSFGLHFVWINAARDEALKASFSDLVRSSFCLDARAFEG